MYETMNLRRYDGGTSCSHVPSGRWGQWTRQCNKYHAIILDTFNNAIVTRRRYFQSSKSNLLCPDETQPSINWTVGIGLLSKVRYLPSKHSYTQNGSYTILSLKLILFRPMPASYGVKTTNTKSVLNSPKQSTQKKKQKKTAFKNRYKSTDPLYKNLKIIKFQDLLRLKNCLFMYQFKQNKKLAATFPGL